MWAFALWDDKKKLLFTARDRFGVKPFYYFWDGHRFVFASEIKGILASGHTKPLPNDSAVYRFLAGRCIDDGETTFFHNIYQLKPFEMMRAVRRQGIKVILGGQGGDEVLGGYVSDMNVALATYLRGLRPLAAWRHMRRVNGFYGDSLLSQLSKGFYHVLPLVIKNSLRSYITECNLANILDSDFLHQYKFTRFEKISKPGWTALDVYLYKTIRKWALPGFLHYEDPNSMAFGVETRQPFLDYRLVEFMFDTTDDAKIKDGELKTLHRKAVMGLIPEKVRLRRDKQGFFASIEKWLLNERDTLLETLFSLRTP